MMNKTRLINPFLPRERKEAAGSAGMTRMTSGLPDAGTAPGREPAHAQQEQWAGFFRRLIGLYYLPNCFASLSSNS